MTVKNVSNDVLEIKTTMYASGMGIIPVIAYGLEGFEDAVVVGFAVLIAVNCLDAIFGNL